MKKLIKDLLSEKELGQKVKISGWVRTNRNSGAIGFLAINDGSIIDNIQVVYGDEVEFTTLRTGDAVIISGEVVESKGNQDIEIKADSVELVNAANEEYPLQKKRHSVEYLREIAHLRPKTNLMMAVMKVRSVAAQAVHEFFAKNGYVWVSAPIITGNDAEGAGESFVVTTRGDGNYEKDFFRKKALLTVSGQLHAEAYAQAFGKVYTFGPTFRAENSNTSRHAAEFWMIEPEIAFANIDTATESAEKLIKYVIQKVLVECEAEYGFIEKFVSKGVVGRLKMVSEKAFARLPYEKMVSILKDAVASGHEFEDSDIKFGMDFGSEHERYIAETVVKGPVFATHYPRGIKSFYMRVTEKDAKTVDSFDLLIPGIGELVGGSARENNLDILIERMKETSTPVKGLEWYLELRKFGGAPSAGYGIGFERLIMYLTGVENIRDVLPFPRTPRNLGY